MITASQMLWNDVGIGAGCFIFSFFACFWNYKRGYAKGLDEKNEALHNAGFIDGFEFYRSQIQMQKALETLEKARKYGRENYPT